MKIKVETRLSVSETWSNIVETWPKVVENSDLDGEHRRKISDFWVDFRPCSITF